MNQKIDHCINDGIRQCPVKFGLNSEFLGTIMIVHIFPFEYQIVSITKCHNNSAIDLALA